MAFLPGKRSFAELVFVVEDHFKKTANKDLDRKSVSEFHATNKMPLVIVLDNIRSKHNVGSVFRTSDAFLVNKIYLTGITATPPHRDINKTALGATESVAWEYMESTHTAVKQLKEDGYIIVSVEQAEPHISLENLTTEKNKKYCLVFGNEVYGVSDEVVRLSDFCLEIPQSGTKHSLNISVSVGIVLWQFYNVIR